MIFPILKSIISLTPNLSLLFLLTDRFEAGKEIGKWTSLLLLILKIFPNIIQFVNYFSKLDIFKNFLSDINKMLSFIWFLILWVCSPQECAIVQKD